MYHINEVIASCTYKKIEDVSTHVLSIGDRNWQMAGVLRYFKRVCCRRTQGNYAISCPYGMNYKGLGDDRERREGKAMITTGNRWHMKRTHCDFILMHHI